MESYQVVIVGGGPAGLAGAIYAGRYGLKTIVFGEEFGGMIAKASEVGNFPGFEKISGFDLAQKMINQVKSFGIEIIHDKILNIKKDGNEFIVTGQKQIVRAKKVILACGTKRRQLGLPRENEIKGISYCNTCDGIYYKDKVVGVIGGGNAACSSAGQLADIAKKVYLFCLEDKFIFAEPARIKQIQDNEKIEKIFGVSITELIGGTRLESVKLSNGTIIPLNALFVEIGSEPNKEFLQNIGLKLDEKGYVIVDRKMRTNIPGLFTAGDVNAETFPQALIAASQGAIAANTAFEEIKTNL